ncbi:MAG: 3-oxoacyl-[acyl-carrier-protein] reductase [Candidatus Aminicenantales bacterium]
MTGFEGRVSIVTGACQGIGLAIAEDLAALGADVCLVDVQKDKLDEAVRAIVARGGKAAGFEASVTRPDQVAAVVEAVVRDHGKIDHLVNNAGITRDALLLRMKDEDWNAVLNINLNGVFNFTRAVLRPMVSARFGRIVSLSSVAGECGNAGQTNYAASKAGILGFSRSLAKEVAGRGVTVNCVAPGAIATAMTDRLPEEIKKAFIDTIPAKRFGLPNEVAHAVRFLLSEESAYITGQVINVNGGMYM